MTDMHREGFERETKTCENCAHVYCLFYGEDREPVYKAPINCWDNAQSALRYRDEQEKGE